MTLCDRIRALVVELGPMTFAEIAAFLPDPREKVYDALRSMCRNGSMTYKAMLYAFAREPHTPEKIRAMGTRARLVKMGHLPPETPPPVAGVCAMLRAVPAINPAPLRWTP